MAKEKSSPTQDDALQRYRLLETLAQALIEQRIDKTQDYKRKLDNLIALTNVLLGDDNRVDASRLDELLNNGPLEIIEKEGRSFALLPVIPIAKSSVARIKRNAIHCSLCGQVGHKRSICPNR